MGISKNIFIKNINAEDANHKVMPLAEFAHEVMALPKVRRVIFEF